MVAACWDYWDEPDWASIFQVPDRERSPIGSRMDLSIPNGGLWAVDDLDQGAKFLPFRDCTIHLWDRQPAQL